MKILTQYKGLTRANYALAIGRMVTNMGAMIMPMLTLILNQKFGLSASKTALWIMLAGLINLPANLIGGQLADRISKKAMIIACDLVSITIYLICGVKAFNFASFIMIMVASFFQTIEGPAYSALVALVTPPGKEDKAFSIQYMGANVGFILAPIIGGFLFNNYLWLCFIIDAVTIAMSTVLIILFVDEKGYQTEEAETTTNKAPATQVTPATQINPAAKGFISMLIKTNKPVILFMLAFALYEGGYSQFSYLMPIDFAKYHGDMGATIYGTVMSVSCFLVVILTPIITQIVESRSNQWKLVAGVAAQILSFGVFLVSLGHIPAYYIAIAIFIVGEILTMLCFSPYIVQAVGPEYRGRAFGWVSFLGAVASGYVMWYSGRYVDANDDRNAWIFTIVICVVALALSILLDFVTKTRPQTEKGCPNSQL
ncbi:Major Facilitator Superfamily protein [Pseudobutyrivibrio sp. JW11]|uniref:MFS transporter n=1 Tax=Pseudobutyrivibrio sp. JW11 TaxID=1855302 RepID=UPI0008F0C0F1|nr:MFS transporter [Pseudobutyrivibrio sp. JW11]SFO56507.1 Major Facilitator Superfamily protein [Pseudobutyrivibrio sp. JW11]